MKPHDPRTLAAALLAAALAVCGAAAPAAAQDGGHSHAPANLPASAQGYAWTAADAHFMTSMIGHHAQAITMARMAPTHGASPQVRTLAERIINAQQDEIATMQTWLRDRGQPVPDPAAPMTMSMNGMQHEMLMPGMLTAAQLAQLDQARGSEFDRLFLTFMIQHHGGAMSMVQRAVRLVGRRAGRGRLQVRVRRERRPDHRDRADAADAGRGRLRRPPAVRAVLQAVCRSLSTPSKEPVMASVSPARRSGVRSAAAPVWKLSLALALSSSAAAAQGTSAPPSPDPRIGLRAGLMDAAEATWNLRVLSRTPPSEHFLGKTNSDLAFTGHYAIQGSYNGWQIWDISDPSHPSLKTAFVCPASQSDVSVYRNLLFVSGEGLTGRLDCGTQGVQDTVSHDRLRGLRIFDISDIEHPRNVGNVQTCRGSHTHTVLADPRDAENVYVYISGSSGVRSPNELPGCVRDTPDKDPNSALFRIEVIKVPLAHPEQAAIVSSPRIFNDLAAPARHGESPEDVAAAAREAAAARARGEFTVTVQGMERVAPQQFVAPLLDSIMKARGGTGSPTGADSAALRASFQGIVDRMFGAPSGRAPAPPSATTSPSTRPSASPAAPARATGCCSTSATRRTRCASRRWPTRTSRTGTRPPSTTTAPRCCSATSGAAAGRPSAAPPTDASGAPTRSSPSRTPASCSSRATTSSRRRRRPRRTAWRTTAR